MANSFLISWCNFKWTTKLFFHLLDLTVLNSWILLSSCGAKYIWDFRLLVVRNLIEEVDKGQDCPTPDWLKDQVRKQQMLCSFGATITYTGQWNPANSAAIFSCPQSEKKSTVYKCTKSDVGLCTEFHTQVIYRSKSVNHPVLWTVGVMIK
jgi:hypothetical protein